ncbi:CBS domain-containing protein [Aestuariimicrobium soli]|uniref:CBS domain-containing protein n=1 Tax=Aestuariimicrobium soli TaxID=2035834 RepID=UPI003EBA839A
MADDELLERYLRACEAIAQSLGRQRHQRFNGLGQAVRGSAGHPVVDRNRDLLLFLADLRNTIQHEGRLRGTPIATPRIDAVVAIEDLAEQIDRPIKVSEFMVKDPISVREQTSLPEAARLIVEHSLSQIPVLDEHGRYDWLLTTNALARWMGAKYVADGGALLEEGGSVADVRRWAESHDQAKTVRPNLSAREACRLLTKSDAPTALIVTSDGDRTGTIAGILTRFDVPAMLERLTVRLGG